MELLAILAALMAGMTIFFLMLAFGKFNKQNNQSESDASFENIIRSEIAVSESDANLPPRNTWAGYWAHLYVESGRVIQNVNLPSYWATFAGVLGFFFGVLVFPRNIIGGVGLAVAAIFGLRYFFQFQANRRVSKIETQLPNLLSAIRANLQANMTPEKAVLNLADQFDGPIGEELRILRNEVSVNIPLDDALQNMSDRVKSPELKFLVSSVKLAVARGVDLDPQIEVIQRIVIQRGDIAGKLRIAIAQVTPTMIISVALIPLGLLWSLSSSEENAAYWSSFFGIVTLGVVGLLYGTGIFLTQRQIAKVKKEQ
jgi:Flp pilus assembly protein TadB